MAQFLAGTSGWNYRNWRGSFYPEDLPPGKYLAFYAQTMRLPTQNFSNARWHKQTPRKPEDAKIAICLMFANV